MRFAPAWKWPTRVPVRAGNDISPFVHHVDVLPHDAADLVHDTLGALYRKLHIRSPFLNALRHMAPAFRPKPAALKLCRTALPVLYTAVRAFPMVYILK